MAQNGKTSFRLVAPFLAWMPENEATRVTREFLKTSLVSLDSSDFGPFDPSKIWSPSTDRSLARKAHGWFFLRYFYSAWPSLKDNEKEAVIASVTALLRQWRNRFADYEMSYHDETTAQRMMNWAVFRAVVDVPLSMDQHIEFLDFVSSELKTLSDPDFYAGPNNHGMFQSVALIVAVELGMPTQDGESLISFALDRLAEYFQRCFTTDGVHTENNPTYHLMVAGYLNHVERYCKETGRSRFGYDFDDILRAADRYTAYALTPRGEFVPISDTASGVVDSKKLVSVFGQGLAAGVASDGEVGKTPNSKTYVSTEAGYGIYRSNWGADAVYLFFSASYMDDYHKHSDEMSLYLAAKSRELIRESGPNGYQYTDPLTKYAFSSASHNSLLVDGEGLSRIGDSAKTRMRDLGSTDEELHVIGETERYEGISWSREVKVPQSENGEVVYITDRITSEKEHTYTFLWHLSPSVTSIHRGNVIEIFDRDSDEKLAELTWRGLGSCSVGKVNGQRHPYVQGWSFPRMGSARASDSVEVDFAGEDLELAWEVRLSNFKIVDRGMTPQSEWRSFQGEFPVNYLLEIPEQSQPIDGLLVVFSAISPLNTFTYNYRASLEGTACATLYILDDFGDQGAYYLAAGRDLAIFRSVQGLLKKVVQDLGITPDKVTTIGSSKGGTAALLHGITFGASRVIAGAPQYRIGDFTKAAHPNVLEYISGGLESADVRWLNQISNRILKSGDRSTKVEILVGDKDSHYRQHAVPLKDDLQMLKYDSALLTLPGTTHAEFGEVFRFYLLSLVRSETTVESQIPHAIAGDKESMEIGAVVSVNRNTTVLGQLYFGAERVGGLVRFEHGKARWKPGKRGLYRVRIYVEEDARERWAFGTRAVRI